MTRSKVNLPPLICDVCGKNVAKGVACSVFGPISLAYCQECLNAKRDDYGFMVAGLCGGGITCMRDIRPDLHPYVKATLEFAEKTEEDLFKELQEFEEEYYRACEEFEE